MSIDEYVATMVARFPRLTPDQIESAARILVALPAETPRPDGLKGGA